MSPRLAPIEAPASWRARLMYALSRWQQGTVITPLKVVWARMPEGARLAYEMNRLEAKLSIDEELRLLVKGVVATINGCTFCQDIAQADAQDENVAAEKWAALPEYEAGPEFEADERAALRYAEEVTRTADVDDATFGTLTDHFDEREIVELAWLVAMENYYNLLNRPLGIGSDGLCTVQGQNGEA